MAGVKYRAHVTNDPIANSAYMLFKKALGLALWEPPSDAQRTAFDMAYCGNYDMNEFLRLAAAGRSMADCIEGAKRDGK